MATTTWPDFMRENDARNVTERRMETVVLWHGQYSNDGAERLPVLERYARLFHLYDVRMEGRGGDWRIVADAYVATPQREGFERTWQLPA